MFIETMHEKCHFQIFSSHKQVIFCLKTLVTMLKKMFLD
jgi:hypothetical protein